MSLPANKTPKQVGTSWSPTAEDFAEIAQNPAAFNAKIDAQRQKQMYGDSIPTSSLTFNAMVGEKYNLRRDRNGNIIPSLRAATLDETRRMNEQHEQEIADANKRFAKTEDTVEKQPLPPEAPRQEKLRTGLGLNDEPNPALGGIENCMPNFMPYSATFQATDMYKRAIQRIPVLNVVQLDTMNFGESLVEQIRKWLPGSDDVLIPGGDAEKVKKMTAAAKGTAFEEAAIAINNIVTISEKQFKPFVDGVEAAKEIPKAIAMLFMTFTSILQNRFKLPIMSSPNLDVKTGAGWEKSTSLFPFITKLTGGLGGPMIEKFAGSLSSFLQYMGKDIMLGPLFSTKTIHENRPTFTCTTYFVNDSSVAAIHNKTILQNLLMGSLPGASGELNIRPGSLFNVAIDIGLGKDDNGKNGVLPLKKMFLCIGNFNIKALGIYRDGVTPEIYELTSTFESLLPDFVNMQMISFSLKDGNNDYNKPVARTEIFKPVTDTEIFSD